MVPTLKQAHPGQLTQVIGNKTQVRLGWGHQWKTSFWAKRGPGPGPGWGQTAASFPLVCLCRLCSTLLTEMMSSSHCPAAGPGADRQGAPSRVEAQSHTGLCWTGASAETNQGALGYPTPGWLSWEDPQLQRLPCTLQRGSLILTEREPSFHTAPLLYHSPSVFAAEYRKNGEVGAATQ